MEISTFCHLVFVMNECRKTNTPIYPVFFYKAYAIDSPTKAPIKVPRPGEINVPREAPAAVPIIANPQRRRASKVMRRKLRSTSSVVCLNFFLKIVMISKISSTRNTPMLTRIEDRNPVLAIRMAADFVLCVRAYLRTADYHNIHIWIYLS